MNDNVNTENESSIQKDGEKNMNYYMNKKSCELLLSKIESRLDALRAHPCLILNKNIIRKYGDLVAAYYAELVSLQEFYDKADKLREGYFYVTSIMMEKATGLSDYQQRNVRKKILDMEWVLTKTFDDDQYNYYKINADKVSKDEDGTVPDTTPSIKDRLRKESIVVNKLLIQSVGLRKALLYSELLSRYRYFARINRVTPKGFFYNTVKDLEEATGLSKKQQRSALATLEELSLLQRKNNKRTRSRYFKILLDHTIVPEKKNVEEFSKEGLKSNREKYPNNGDEFLFHDDRNMLEINMDQLNRYLEENKAMDPADKQFVRNTFEYYFDKYYEVFRRDHPVIKKEYVQKYTQKCVDLSRQYDIYDTEFEELIIHHFQANYTQEIDYNIYHFLSETIIGTALFKKGKYGRASL